MRDTKLKILHTLLALTLAMAAPAFASIERCMEFFSSESLISETQIETAFRRLLTESGPSFPTTAELERMAAAADPFQMNIAGESHRAHLRKVLETLRAVVEKHSAGEKLRERFLAIVDELLVMRRAAGTSADTSRETRQSTGHRLLRKFTAETNLGPATNSHGQIVVADPRSLTWFDPVSGENKVHQLELGSSGPADLRVLKLWDDGTVWASNYDTGHVWNVHTGKTAVVQGKITEGIIRLKDDIFIAGIFFRNDQYVVDFQRLALADGRFQRTGEADVPLFRGWIEGEHISGLGPSADGRLIRLVTTAGRVWDCDPMNKSGEAQPVFELGELPSTRILRHPPWRHTVIARDGSRITLVPEHGTAKVFDGRTGKLITDFELPAEIDWQYRAGLWLSGDGKILGFPGSRRHPDFTLVFPEERGRSVVVPAIPASIFRQGTLAIPSDGKSVVFKAPTGELYQAEVED